MFPPSTTRRFFLSVSLLVLAAGPDGLLRGAVAAAPDPTWSEFVLAQDKGLKAVLRFKQPATLADQNWIQLEITNDGIATEIKGGFLSIAKGRELDPKTNQPLNHTWGALISNAGLVGSRGGVGGVSSSASLPVGKTDCLDGLALALAGENLRLPGSSGWRIEATVTFAIGLSDGRALATPAGGMRIEFSWTEPTPAQMTELQVRLSALLKKDKLSQADAVWMRYLLNVPEVSSVLTPEPVLAALKQHAADLGDTFGSQAAGPNFEFNQLLGIAFQRWLHEPAVLAYFRAELVEHPQAILYMLSQYNFTSWDDAMTEMMVKSVEACAATAEPKNRELVANALEIMDRHYSDWAKDATIPPRLSKAVLRVFPTLLEAVQSSVVMRPGLDNWYKSLTTLAETHDEAMVTVIRPFLKVKNISSIHLVAGNYAPIRDCEVASNAIHHLLGDVEIIPYTTLSASIPLKFSYPEWLEWDQKIVELEKRLDALPKK